MVLALEHRTIPPNIRFTSPHPKIPFDSAKLTVPLEPMPWPQGKLERVSVNSFGIGGANSHAILDSAASFNASPSPSNYPQTPQLLLYSANAPRSLEKMAAQYESWIENNPDKAGDLAYTLARRREHLPYRSFAVVNNGMLGRSAPATRATQKHAVVMVFTGQGAQWPLMGRELLQSNAIFQKSIRYLDEQLQAMTKDGNKALYSIKDELLKAGKKSRVNISTISQPLCTAVQIALVDTFKSVGITPQAVIGHSSGEIAAAYAAGSLTTQEAIVAAHHRGAVTCLQRKHGAMAAIGISWEETERFLVPNVNLACHNSPDSVTISGDAEAVQTVIANIKTAYPDALARPLQVDKAYHSHHMAEIGEQYLALIGPKVEGKDPSCATFFSSVTGKELNSENRRLDSKYWRNNLESPVRFCEAVTSLLKHEIGKRALFLEIGPHGALAGPLRQITTKNSASIPYVQAMARNQNCIESFLTAIGKLHSLHVSVDLHALMPDGTCLKDLPRYPWNHEDSYWYESRLARDWRNRKFPYHDLLGAKTAESTDIEPVWRNLFHLDNVPWVRDHKVGDDIVFPFAGYIALAGEAVRQVTGISEGFSIRNIDVGMALVVSEGKPTEIMTTFRPYKLTKLLNSQWWEFTVAAYNGHTWNKHCTGEIIAMPDTQLGSASKPSSLPRMISVRKWFDAVREGGLDLGPAFHTLQSIETSTHGENRANGKIALGEVDDTVNYHIHPTMIDGTLQLLGPAAVKGYVRKIRNWLPTSIDKFTLTRCTLNMHSMVSAKITSNMSLVGDAYCVSEDGMKVIEASGIRMSPADGSQATIDMPDTHAASQHTWGPHIDFLDIQELIKPVADRAESMPLLDELAKLCLESSLRLCSQKETVSKNMQQYATWLASHVSKGDNAGLASLSDTEIATKIDDLVQRLSQTSVAAAAIAVHQVCMKMELLLEGKPLGDVIAEDVLRDLNSFIDGADQSRFIKYFGHSKPNLRILEIGIGREPAMNDIMNSLTLPGEQKNVLCFKYTFTSIGYISSKDQQKTFPNTDYATLDISKDLAEQGFEDSEYDLIIATNVLHATKDVRKSLSNIRTLLSPDGRLLFREVCPSNPWINYIFGVQPSWWRGHEDGRMEGPALSTQKWQMELSAAGFDDADGIIFDSPEPTQMAATILVRPASKTPPAKGVTLLCRDKKTTASEDRIIKELEKSGYEVTRCTLENSPPQGLDVISLLDAEAPFLADLDSAGFEALKTFVLALQDAGILWLTKLSSINCQDPRYAQIVGFARTMRSEVLLDFATCEVDNYDRYEEIIKVIAKFGARDNNGALEPDFEYAIKDKQIHVGRFYPFALRDELLITEAGDRAILDISTPGRINSLQWLRVPREQLQNDEIEIEVYSAGLNFRVSCRLDAAISSPSHTDF